MQGFPSHAHAEVRVLAAFFNDGVESEERLDALDYVLELVLGEPFDKYRIPGGKVESAHLLGCNPPEGLKTLGKSEMEGEARIGRCYRADERHAGTVVEPRVTHDERRTHPLGLMPNRGAQVESDNVALFEQHAYQSSLPTASPAG